MHPGSPSSAKKVYRVSAHMLVPAGDTISQGTGSTMRVACERAVARMAFALSGRKPKNRMLIEFNVLERPTKSTDEGTPDN